MARKLYLGGKYRKRYVVVDDEDYDYLTGLAKWEVSVGCSVKKTAKGERKTYRYPWRGYAMAHLSLFGKKRVVFVHKVVAERKYGYECPQGYQIDHINNNPKDNRRCNLQFIPAEENTRKTTQSGKGYSYNTSQKAWVVRFKRTDPFTKKGRVAFYRNCKTENEARLVANLYKKGYKVPKRKRGNQGGRNKSRRSESRSN